MARRPSLTNLPVELQRKILTELSNMSCKDSFRARAASKSFASFLNETEFLKGVSILSNDTPSSNRTGMSKYYESCYKAGNLEVMLLTEVTGIMYDHFNYPAEALELIRKAAKGGSEYGRYVYEIIRKSLWVGEMNKRDVPELSKDDAREIRRKIVQMKPVVEMDYDLILASHVSESLDEIGVDFLADCDCSTYHAERDIEDPMVKDLEGMCSNCFWKIETIVMCRLLRVRFRTLPFNSDLL